MKKFNYILLLVSVIPTICNADAQIDQVRKVGHVPWSLENINNREFQISPIKTGYNKNDNRKSIRFTETVEYMCNEMPAPLYLGTGESLTVGPGWRGDSDEKCTIIPANGDPYEVDQWEAKHTIIKGIMEFTEEDNRCYIQHELWCRVY